LRRIGLQGKLRILIELQDVQSRLSQIKKLKETLPLEIERLDEEIKKEKESLNDFRNELENLNKERRAKEKILEANSQKIKKYEKQLYSVKTNREYQALLNEIALLKESNERIEEDIIVIMERIDEMRDELKRREKEFEKKEVEFGKRKEEILNELSGFEQEVASNKKRNEELIKNCDSSILLHYQKLIQKGNGLAVVPVVDGICQGCYLNIPPQLYNEVLKQKELITCPFCHRILYPLNKPEVEEGQKETQGKKKSASSRSNKKN
jgi:predicted  nucleic acid-binding Zn-ribbon protein